MKKTIIITLMLAIAAYTSAQKQIIFKNNYLGMGFTSIVNNTWRVDYERVLKNENSIVISAGVIIKMNENYNIKGGQGEVQYRFNSKGGTLKENVIMYCAPYVGYQQIDYITNGHEGTSFFYEVLYQDKDKYQNFENIQGGFLFGIKAIPANNIYLDMNIGGGMRYTLNYDNENFARLGTMQLGYSGIYPRGSLTIGVNF